MYAKGVSYEKVRSNFVVVEKSNLNLFKTHPEIDKIRCVYFNGVLKHVLVKHRPHSDFYDLTFVADSLAFLYKFGKVNINLPIEKLDSLKSSLDLHGCLPFETLDVFIRHDSTIFDYSLRCLEVNIKKVNTDRQIGYPAKFIGDLNLVKNKLELEYKNMVIKADTTLVFFAKINAKGIIQDVKLEVGDPSVFSENINRHLFKGISGEFRYWKLAIVCNRYLCKIK